MTMLSLGDTLIFLGLLAFVSFVVWLSRRRMPRPVSIVAKGFASFVVLIAVFGAAFCVFIALPVNNDTADYLLSWRSVACNGALVASLIMVLAVLFRIIWRNSTPTNRT